MIISILLHFEFCFYSDYKYKKKLVIKHIKKTY